MKNLLVAMAAAVAGTVFGATHNVPADGDLETVVEADAPDFYGRAWNPDRVDIGAAVYDCKGLLLLLK